jgi:hypothetical protein
MDVGAFFDFDFDFSDGSVVVFSFSTNSSYASITEDTGRRERERTRRTRTRTRARAAQQQHVRATRTHRRRQPAAIAPVNFAQNVAAGGPGPAPAAPAAPAAPFDPNAETCCIGVACKQPRPDFTWLPCCENSSMCFDCLIEHTRRSGSTCPLCRGDLDS